MSVKWGQNFLINSGILDRIIEFSDITRNDCIVEIGTGPGNLTQYLSQKAGKVFTFEIDTDLCSKAQEALSGFSNVQIFNEDFLHVDLSQILSPFLSYSLKFVANIPYEISSAVLLKVIQAPIYWERLVVMVQKEFGQKLTALPGEKSRVPLSVLFQSRFFVQRSMKVARGNFRPQPRVDSVVFQCFPHPHSLSFVSINRIHQLAQFLFTQKRKKIGNTLRSILNPEIFFHSSFAWDKRPEDLTPKEWVQLETLYNEEIKAKRAQCFDLSKQVRKGIGKSKLNEL